MYEKTKDVCVYSARKLYNGGKMLALHPIESTKKFVKVAK